MSTFIQGAIRATKKGFHFVTGRFIGEKPVLQETTFAGECTSGLEVKRQLHAQGKSLRQWADEHGYPYHLVSNVVRGINKGTFGKGYEVAIKLGMQKPQKDAA